LEPFTLLDEAVLALFNFLGDAAFALFTLGVETFLTTFAPAAGAGTGATPSTVGINGVPSAIFVTGFAVLSAFALLPFKAALLFESSREMRPFFATSFVKATFLAPEETLPTPLFVVALEFAERFVLTLDVLSLGVTFLDRELDVDVFLAVAFPCAFALLCAAALLCATVLDFPVEVLVARAGDVLLLRKLRVFAAADVLRTPPFALGVATFFTLRAGAATFLLL
jgi:hypothetical protein